MRSNVVVGAVCLSAVLVACGGSDNSQPPLTISAANQEAVASEVLVGAGQVTGGGGVTGGISYAPIVVAAIKPQLAALAATARRNPGQPLPADGTEDCAFGGTLTTAENGTTSAKVTYNQCQQTQGIVLNGTVNETLNLGNNTISASLSIDLTATIGTLSIAESGDLELHLSSGNDLSFDMTSDHLEATIKNNGTVVDDITLSDLTVHFGTSTSGGQTVSSASEKYHIDSSKLVGSFTVTSTANVAVGSGKYAASGTLTITGSSGSTLTITIMGDETYTAASGEGQIKLELNGTVTWTNWADLAAAAAAGKS